MIYLDILDDIGMSASIYSAIMPAVFINNNNNNNHRHIRA